MAEKGIIVSDASSGESVGCADLRSQDDDLNSRIIQYTSNNVTPTSMEALEDGTPVRTLDMGASGASKGDGMDISSGSITADILSSVLDVSDKSAFTLSAVMTPAAQVGELTMIQVTPLLINDAGTKVCGILPPYFLCPPSSPQKYSSASMKTYGEGIFDHGKIITLSDEYTGTKAGVIQTYPTLGAKYVGFHICGGLEESEAQKFEDPISATVKVFADGLSGEQAHAALSHAMYAHKQGISPFLPTIEAGS